MQRNEVRPTALFWYHVRLVLHIVVLSPRSTQTINLRGDVTIGAAPEASIRIDDADLAPIHCRIEERAEGFVLVREASTLLVNGQRLRVHVLAPEDMVVLGKVAICVRAGVAPVVLPPGTALARLSELRASLARGDAPVQIASKLVSDVVQLARGTQGALVRFAATDDPVQIASATTHGFTEDEAAFSRTLLARMVREERAIFVPNTLEDGELANARSLVATGPLSALAVPVFAGDRVVGALYVSAQSIPGLSPEATVLATAYAAEASAILDAHEARGRLAQRLETLGEPEGAAWQADEGSPLIGLSTPMVRLRGLVRKVASNAAPVLVRGETGTGKEVVAREIHRLSPRAKGPFVALNCGAIPEALLASELFGHVKGAFTGAVSERLGAFRGAQGGTLFLDEIGEMPLVQQVSLLRTLQERTVTPVGSERAVSIDVRIVLATHRDLEAEVKQGRFRQDLYYRVAMLLIDVPPLRTRGGDVLMLAQHFLRIHGAGRHLSLSEGASQALSAASFPGNVRELEALITRAALMAEIDTLQAAHLGLSPEQGTASSALGVRPLSMVRDAFLRTYVQRVVDDFGGNRTQAADALMVSVRTVFKYLEE
jgi:transcriptional regulator with GAF, ATPase, and Fis domain